MSSQLCHVVNLERPPAPVSNETDNEPRPLESTTLERTIHRTVPKSELSNRRNEGFKPVTAEQAAETILSLLFGSGAKPGDSFAVLIAGSDFEIDHFNGALQTKFLENHTIADLKDGLACAVERTWLSLGRRFGVCGETQAYVLEVSEFPKHGV
jgi:hypothetical protein